MFSTLSVLVGAFSALSQTKIKRFLAYSSINQLGFLLLATLEGTYLGLVVSLVAIFIYSVTLVLFIYYIGNSTVLVNSLSKQVSPLFVKSNATSVTRYYPMRRFLESKSNQVSRPINYLTDLLMI
jgi:NADH:ubiquinone oxidoreductase subunit 2 (subunit N)